VRDRRDGLVATLIPFLSHGERTTIGDGGGGDGDDDEAVTPLVPFV